MDDDTSAPVARMTSSESGEFHPPALRYEASVSLSMDEVRQAFEQDPRVAWYPNANPPPFGSPATHEFEAWPDGPSSIVIRTNVPASIQTASPYVLVEMQSLEPLGTRVRARFVRRPPGVQLSKTVRVVLMVSCVFAVLFAVAYVALIPLMLFHPTLWVTVVGSIGGILSLAQYSRNRPKPESMAAFGSSLWGLVGNKLVPHALGEGEDPFRLKALGGR
jgi:hypothetical protein